MAAGGGKDGTELDGFAQIGVAKEDQPHYLKLLGRPDADLSKLAEFAPADTTSPLLRSPLVRTSVARSAASVYIPAHDNSTTVEIRRRIIEASSEVFSIDLNV